MGLEGEAIGLHVHLIKDFKQSKVDISEVISTRERLRSNEISQKLACSLTVFIRGCPVTTLPLVST